ncbi:reverse transcriptase domain-containing protein [Tanacetum coccineum]
MIKEHDQQAKTKATPRKLAYADSNKEAPARSIARGFSDRFSFESSGTSDTHKQTRSANKSQRTPSKNKELAHLRRLRRLEDQSITKEYAKDPTEIHDIKRRQNEGLHTFMDRFKSESSHIKGVPLVLRILAFMHGHGHPELAKKLNDKIRKTGSQHQRLLLVKKENRGSCSLGEVGPSGEGYLPEQPEEREPRKEQCKGVIKGNQVRRILVDGGSSSKIMYEHCFKSLNVNIQLRFRRCRVLMVGFSGETYHPLGIIDLRENMGRAGRNKTVLMEFAIIKCCSSYNVIIGRTGNEKHRSSRHLERVQGSWKEVQWRQREEQMSRIREQVILRTKSIYGRRPNSGLSRSKRMKHGNILGRNSNRKQKLRGMLRDIPFGVREGRFLVHIVTKEGVRVDPEKVQAIILSPTPKGPNQIRSLFLQLTTISKFIPKLAELKYPIRKVRMRFKTGEGFDWTNEAEEALRRIKRKLKKLQTLAIPKEGEVLMLCLRQRNKTISFVLLVEREGIQIPVSYVSRPLQGMDICYTPTEKMVQALIHTTRSQKAVFRKHKVKVVTDGPMEEILKLSGREGRLAKWAAKETPDANEGGTFNLSKKLQAKSNPTPRAWRLHLGKETIEEGSGVGIILVNFNEILEDLGSIIDSGLSEVVLGQPFAHTSKLTYDESLGLIRFSQRDDEVVFRMPQRTKELDRVSPLEKDKFEAFFVDSLKVRKMGFKHVLEKRKGYYKACTTLGQPRRKAHFLEDKQIPSVGVFDEAFGGNTRDLGSFGEEMDKTTNLHQHLLRISTQKLETASQITRDAVTTHLKTASQDLQTASDCTTQPII